MKHKICVVDVVTNRRVVEIDTVCASCGSDLTAPGKLTMASLTPVYRHTSLKPDEDNGVSGDFVKTWPNDADPTIEGLDFGCSTCGEEIVSGTWVAQ